MTSCFTVKWARGKTSVPNQSGRVSVGYDIAPAMGAVGGAGAPEKKPEQRLKSRAEGMSPCHRCHQNLHFL